MSLALPRAPKSEQFEIALITADVGVEVDMQRGNMTSVCRTHIRQEQGLTATRASDHAMH
eukprot:6484567-Amphidinium_carterae.2